jgi:hypothetical protein
MADSSVIELVTDLTRTAGPVHDLLPEVDLDLRRGA